MDNTVLKVFKGQIKYGEYWTRQKNTLHRTRSLINPYAHVDLQAVKTLMCESDKVFFDSLSPLGDWECENTARIDDRLNKSLKSGGSGVSSEV